MAKSHALRFIAKRVIAKPIKLHFKLKSGRTISIKAIRTYEQKVVARPRSTKK